jgi:single-strand DNA-binding protein
MNEVQVTVVGTVCSEVRYGTAGENGVPVARFQIRSLPRRYDRRSGAWTDGDPSYYSVTCWRRLAEHAASSLGVGDPVLATGRLKISRWKRNEESMVSAEIDAQSVGHDLRWGTSVYRKGVPLAGRVPAPRRRGSEEPVGDAPGLTAEGLEAVDAADGFEVESTTTASADAGTDTLAETAMAA